MYSTILNALARKRAALSEKDKGFTLIELLVVVIIIGILAAIAIPVYLGIQNNAKESATQSDVTNAKTAVIAAQTTTGSLPAAGDISTGLAGFTKSDDTTSVTLFGDGDAFCIVGVSSTTTQFYATDSTGTTKVDASHTLPTLCSAPAAP